jgi:hypothetical protein
LHIINKNIGHTHPYDEIYHHATRLFLTTQIWQSFGQVILCKSFWASHFWQVIFWTVIFGQSFFGSHFWTVIFGRHFATLAPIPSPRFHHHSNRIFTPLPPIHRHIHEFEPLRPRSLVKVVKQRRGLHHQCKCADDAAAAHTRVPREEHRQQKQARC